MYQLEGYKGLNFYTDEEIASILSKIEGKEKIYIKQHNGTSTEYHIIEGSDYGVCVCSFPIGHKTVVLISMTDIIEGGLIKFDTNVVIPIYIKNAIKHGEAVLIKRSRNESLLRRNIKKVAYFNPYNSWNIINTDEVYSMPEIVAAGYNSPVSENYSLEVVPEDDYFKVKIIEVDRTGRNIVNKLRGENYHIGMFAGCHLRISKNFKTEKEAYRGIGLYNKLSYGEYAKDVFREYLAQNLDLAVDYLVNGVVTEDEMKKIVLEAYKDDWRLILANNLEAEYEKYGIEYSLP